MYVIVPVEITKKCIWLSCIGRSMYDMCGIMLIIGDEPEDADLDDPHIYEPIVDLDSLAKRLLTFQQSYNESIRGAGMDLVFFKVFALTLC